MSRISEKLEEITLSMAVSCAMAVAVAVYIGWWAYHPEAPFLPLLAVTSALVGWVVAILATPYSKEEKEQFSEFGKVVSGIVTGFLLGKLGPVIDALVAVPEKGGRPLIMEAGVWPQVMVTVGSFLLAFLFVFGGRLYWSSDGEEPLRQWIRKRPGKKLSRKEAIKLLVEQAG